MDEKSIKELARQLRKPEGELAEQVIRKMNESNAEMNRQTIAALDVKPRDYILEIGMGNGKHVKEILEKSANLKYSGVDYSEEMVHMAKELNQQLIRQNKVDFTLGSADKLPFRDNTFDKVITVNTIYFWEHPEVELKEIQRVLKNKGELILGIRPKESMQKFPFVQYNFKLYSELELVDLLQKAGYTIKEIKLHQEKEIILDEKKYKLETLLVKAEVRKEH